MSDRFVKEYTDLTSVVYDAFPIVSNNDLTFSQPTRAVYVGGSGNLHVQMLSYDNSNTEITFVNVIAGSLLPIRVKKVFANTTANSIVGLF